MLFTRLANSTLGRRHLQGSGMMKDTRTVAEKPSLC